MEGFTDRRYSDSIFLHSPIPIAYVNPDGTFREVNDALCEFLEYSEYELKHLNFADVTYPMDLKADQRMVQECLRGERDSYPMRKRYIPKQSHAYKWAHLKVFVIRNEDGSVNHFVAWIIPLESTVVYEKSKGNGDRVMLSVRGFNELVAKYKKWIVSIAAVVAAIIGAWQQIRAALIKLGDFLAR